MTYPRVMSERETLAAAIAGRSLARFGDGELAIAWGKKAVSQKADPKLALELREILRGDRHVLPCIPNLVSCTPRWRFWEPFRAPTYTSLYYPTEYGSSFITRPDNAPWIDRPDYWDEVRKLWAGKSVAYVGGDKTLLSVMDAAARIDVVMCPKRDAYSEIDSLTDRLLSRPYDAVIIAAGAAGTALAWRLGQDGAQHALDLGHIGQFMQNPGAFSFDQSDLTSPAYKALLEEQHRKTNWGKGGHSWSDKVRVFARELGATGALDYGCGRGTLKPALEALGLKCTEYDPGIPGKDIPPKLADLVVCTDVLEHVEPEKVDAVLRHIFCLARKGAFLAIAKKPAKAILGDGRNAHLICQEDGWWLERLRAAGWTDLTVTETAWKKCVIQCRKS